MQDLSARGREVVAEVAARHGVSEAAVAELLRALASGQGVQAQFNHSDLGGMGQWSQGGMTMVGDMFNNALKAKVDALCTELSGLLRDSAMFAARPASFQSQSQSSGGGDVSLFVPRSGGADNWWPEGLGAPASVGSQNNLRYAVFPAARRLAIDAGGAVTVYDTGEHVIAGFSQQQSGDQSLSFTSQHGLVRIADLMIVGATKPEPEAATPETAKPTLAAVAATPLPASIPAGAKEDIFAKIEKLAALRAKDIITEDEFAAKKAELLARL